MENLSNDFATTLASAITDTIGTAISVVSGTGSPAVQFRIRIDDEIMLVTSKGAGTNWTVQRGVEGTTAATHIIATAVAHIITAAGLEHYGDENFVSIYPGAETGKVRLVPSSHQLLVAEELVVEGELVIDGAVYVMPMS